MSKYKITGREREGKNDRNEDRQTIDRSTTIWPKDRWNETAQTDNTKAGQESKSKTSDKTDD